MDAAVKLAELDPESLINLLTRQLDDREHLPWDKLRHKTPPEGLDHHTWWFLLKSTRQRQARPVDLRQIDGSAFTYVMTDRILRACEHIAQQAGGNVQFPANFIGPGNRDEYVVRSLIEEAITSSQLEGASTSRRAAKEMLQTEREPRDTSELMILNNFQAMKFVRSIAQEDLTPALVLEIHRVVTDGTLEDPSDAGRLEQPDEKRVSVWGHGDQLLHTPPPASELESRLATLCKFANGYTETTPGGASDYLSPVIRSIILHFMVGYDHYFADGNGRTARALFYWSMLHHGYWLTEYLTISTILRKAPSQYSYAYLLTEDDGGDLTYFIHYNLGVIERALNGLNEYLQRKSSELHTVRQELGLSPGVYSHREIQVLEDAVVDPTFRMRAKDYSRRFQVSLETARSDLNHLVQEGLFRKSKHSKAFVWSPVDNLGQILKAHR